MAGAEYGFEAGLEQAGSRAMSRVFVFPENSHGLYYIWLRFTENPNDNDINKIKVYILFLS